MFSRFLFQFSRSSNRVLTGPIIFRHHNKIRFISESTTTAATSNAIKHKMNNNPLQGSTMDKPNMETVSMMSGVNISEPKNIDLEVLDNELNEEINNNAMNLQPISRANTQNSRRSGPFGTQALNSTLINETNSAPQPANIEKQLDPERFLIFEDITLASILKRKYLYGDAIITVKCSDRVQVAHEVMNMYNIGALLVVDDNNPNEVKGIFSTRDYMRKVYEDNLDPINGLMKEYMTESPVFAYSDETALHCMKLMKKHNFRHLPVRDRKTDKTIGLITIGDLVRTMLEEFRDSNAFLREYLYLR